MSGMEERLTFSTKELKSLKVLERIEGEQIALLGIVAHSRELELGRRASFFLGSD